MGQIYAIQSIVGPYAEININLLYEIFA